MVPRLNIEIGFPEIVLSAKTSQFLDNSTKFLVEHDQRARSGTNGVVIATKVRNKRYTPAGA